MADYPKNLAQGLLFIHVWFLISLLSPLIRLLKLPRLLQLLSPHRVTPGRWPAEQVVGFTDSILGQESFIYRRNCLKRTLSLYYFLSRLGLPVQVNLGVRKGGEKLEGHGWLSLEGRPYLEPGTAKADFRLVYTFPQRV